jgi:hypothetical protein
MVPQAASSAAAVHAPVPSHSAHSPQSVPGALGVSSVQSTSSFAVLQVPGAEPG